MHKTNVPKRLGIWMDHSSAHLMEFTADPIETKSVESAFTPFVRSNTLGKSEHVMHNKEQHQHADYYKKLGEQISHYDHIILFGPTEAKSELFNVLREDPHFSDKRIFVQQADKMTENQQHAFVREYFAKHQYT